LGAVGVQKDYGRERNWTRSNLRADLKSLGSYV